MIDYLISRCNLNEKERALVYARAKEEITQEEYAEKIGYTPRHVQRMETKAFDKLIRNWSQLDFLKYM